jgi:hypothetical protein
LFTVFLCSSSVDKSKPTETTDTCKALLRNEDGESTPHIRIDHKLLQQTADIATHDCTNINCNRKYNLTKGLKRLNSSDNYSGYIPNFDQNNDYTAKGSIIKPPSGKFVSIKEESRQSTTSFGMEAHNEDLDDFLLIERKTQQEVLKDEAFSFDDIAFDTVIGVGEEDEVMLKERAKLNLLNVMNNRIVDQKSDVLSLERSCDRMNATYKDVIHYDLGDKNRTVSMNKPLQKCDKTDKTPIMKYLSISLVKDNQSHSNSRKIDCNKFSIHDHKGQEYREKGAFSNERTLKPKASYLLPKSSNTNMKNSDYTNRVDRLFTKRNHAPSGDNESNTRTKTPNELGHNDELRGSNNHYECSPPAKYISKIPNPGYRTRKKKDGTKLNKISLYPVKYKSM